MALNGRIAQIVDGHRGPAPGRQTPLPRPALPRGPGPGRRGPDRRVQEGLREPGRARHRRLGPGQHRPADRPEARTYNLLDAEAARRPAAVRAGQRRPGPVRRRCWTCWPASSTDTVFNVISKSGETAETASQFLIVRDLLIKQLGADKAKRQIIVHHRRQERHAAQRSSTPTATPRCPCPTASAGASACSRRWACSAPPCAGSTSTSCWPARPPWTSAVKRPGPAQEPRRDPGGHPLR